MVCDDKNLDPDVHEIRHPVNVDERLRGSCSLSDYQLQEVCVVSSDFRPPPLSVTDLITMSSIAHPEDKKRRGIFGLFSRKAKSSTGDSSLSSGSAGERSVSPARSDESNEGRPTPPTQSPNSSSGTLTNNNHKADTSITSAASSQRNSFNSVNSSSSQISRPVSMISLNKNKKRQAPVPPQRVKRTIDGRVGNDKSNDSKEKPSLSRHSSDSSGYHEQEIRSSYTSPSNSEVSSFEVTRNSIPPTTNLTSVSSSSSMSSLKGGKRKAPCPPKPPVKNGIEGPVSIPESPEENESNESLKGDQESDRRSIASSSVGKSSSEGNGDEDVVRNDEIEDNRSQVSLSKDKKIENMPVDADSLPPSPKPEHSSPIIIMESKVIEKNTVEESEEFSSLDTNSLPKSNESVKDDNHNESKDLKKSVLNTNEKSDVELSPYPTESYESPLPSLVLSENEIPQTVSLSSETSDASLEMLNPMDIQRPKRHRRKGIPEAFMINPTFVDDTSNSSHPHKDFESVNEVEEYAREYEENNSVEENLQILARPVQLTEGLNGTTEDSEGRNLSSDTIISDIARTSRLSVIYVEDVNEEESTTDPLTPPTERRQIYTSKVQLSTSEDDNLTSFPTRDNSLPDHRSVSITQITSVEEKQTPTQDISKSDVIAELKSAIESSDENSDLQPRILNFKPKEKNEWHYGRPSDYNLILNFKKKPDSPNDSPFNRSASISSYESVDNNNSFRKRSSTETSYESAPPPPPDSRPPPFNSDGDSKTSSSVASRQSSFNDNDNVDFIKPRVPAFSIATYQNRASKISYDKKLSRSESLVSFKDLQTNEDGKSSETKKLTRSDSQRNEIFKSDSLKKSTSTTFLNQNNSSTEYSDKIANASNVRPSLIKSQSRSSLYENGSNQPQNGTIQFDISSSKEPITFNRTLPNTYSNLRKAKSSLDIRGNDGRMTDGFQTIPDSGLASEYMRLQDDFMKWQHQLLQNQQLLHNRVAPIASNPPVLNNTGRFGGGLRLGWKTQVPWLVNNMVNPTPTNTQGMPQRRPVEITIPIKFEDSDEESPNEAQSRAYSKPVVQKPISQNPPSSGPRWVGPPNVSVDSWQERPSYVVMPQPVVIEPQLSRPFDSQPRMQTIFQSAPQETVLPSNNYYQSPQPIQQKPIFQSASKEAVLPSNNYYQGPSPIQQKPIFQSAPQETVLPSDSYYQSPQPIQQKPQPIFQQQNVRTNIQQNPPRPEFQQAQPSPIIPQVPQPNFQRPSRNEVQPIPQNNFRQGPQSRYQQPLQPSIDPQTSEANFQLFSEPETQFTTKSFPQFSSRPQISSNATPFVNDKNDDGINARFSSVVTLSNDKNDKNPVQKDKVRSVVQLNNSDNPFENQISTPFHSKILNNAPKIAENVEKENNGAAASPAGSPFAAPMSSRLVQQAVQQPPAGGFRISPPKIERYSPSRVERSSPPQIERKYSPQMDRQPSPFKHETSPPFGDVKLRHVETRESPPRSEVPQPPAPPPPPPPPSMNAPPPPPPPPMSEAERRTATGKKIFGAANVPQLDARTELMMAIRQFGGSGKLRRSGHPPPNS